MPILTTTNNEPNTTANAPVEITVSNKVYLLVRSFILGIGQGFQPVAGYNFGAGDVKRTKQSFWFATGIGTAVCVLSAGLIALFPQNVIAFFRDDPDVIAIGRVALRFQAVVFPLNASVVISNMMMQSMGKGVKASILAAGRNGLFFIPSVLLLTRFFGLTGLEMSQAVADLATFLLMVPLTRSILRELGD